MPLNTRLRSLKTPHCITFNICFAIIVISLQRVAEAAIVPLVATLLFLNCQPSLAQVPTKSPSAQLPLQVLWRAPLKKVNTYSAQLAMGDGNATVFLLRSLAGPEDNNPDDKMGIVALNHATGKQLWTKEGLGRTSPPAIGADNIVHLTSAKKGLLALSGSNGKVLWSKLGSFHPSVARSGDAILAQRIIKGTTLTQLESYNVRTGAFNFSFTLSKGATSNALYTLPGPLCLNLGAGGGLSVLTAIQLSTQKVLWKWRSTQNPSVLMCTDTEILVQDGKRLLLLRGADGYPLWTASLPGTVEAVQHIRSDTVALSINAEVPDADTTAGMIQLVSLKTGKPLWTFRTGNEENITFAKPLPAQDGNLLAFGYSEPMDGDEGAPPVRLYRLDTNTGKRLAVTQIARAMGIGNALLSSEGEVTLLLHQSVGGEILRLRQRQSRASVLQTPKSVSVKPSIILP